MLPSDQYENQRDIAFQNAKVFTMQDEIFGMPAKFFVVGLAMSIGLGVLTFWWLAPIMALLYYVPMYEIHKDDPRGIDVWRRAMTCKYRYWSSGRSQPTELIIMEKSPYS